MVNQFSMSSVPAGHPESLLAITGLCFLSAAAARWCGEKHTNAMGASKMAETAINTLLRFTCILFSCRLHYLKVSQDSSLKKTEKPVVRLLCTISATAAHFRLWSFSLLSYAFSRFMNFSG